MSTAFDTLDERGFVHQCTDPEAVRELLREPSAVYIGFDPSADSLHVGSLVPMVGLRHLQLAGHKVIALVGGATGMIGDPSGRSEERQLLDTERLEANVAAVHRQLERFLDTDGPNPAEMVNNADWTAGMSFIDWLRDVGKYFTVNYMIAKDSVKSRLQSEHGISYTEFSYMTLQAYDFLTLYDTYGCRLQAGGSDQWGNITAGVELIRKRRGQAAHGLTFPLLATSSGEKFGKSAGNAIWLDADRTTPWDLYQYFVRQDDRDVIRMLKLLTFVPMDRIRELEVAVADNPGDREAQKVLAYEITALLHGAETADEVVRAAETIYYSEIKDMSDDMLGAVFADVPSVEVSRADLEAGVDVVDVLVTAGLAKGKGAARRLLQQGGVYVNNVRVEPGLCLGPTHLASESFLVLRAGKKNQRLLRVV
jgi:tyrosyl-tRNA synthetase